MTNFETLIWASGQTKDELNRVFAEVEERMRQTEKVFCEVCEDIVLDGRQLWRGIRICPKCAGNTTCDRCEAEPAECVRWVRIGNGATVQRLALCGGCKALREKIKGQETGWSDT